MSNSGRSFVGGFGTQVLVLGLVLSIAPPAPGQDLHATLPSLLAQAASTSGNELPPPPPPSYAPLPAGRFANPMRTVTETGKSAFHPVGKSHATGSAGQKTMPEKHISKSSGRSQTSPSAGRRFTKSR